MSKRWGYLVAWLLAAGLAVTVGVVAASTVGASIRGRGPIGPEVGVDTAVEATPDPDAPAVRDRIEGEYGAFVVECRGTFASGIRAEPARAAGWRVISFEPGPDDDVDAVFSDGRNSVDLEVFCNRGRPTLAELERNTLGADD